ncbi:UNVERIFIED_CONTAM: hypothetical protein Sindi_0995900 [Sesamum indicum]
MSEASNQKDPGWNYASLPDPNNTNTVKCNFCAKVHKGGITRHKQHLIGGFRNSKPCPKCPEHVRAEIREYVEKKKQLKDQMDAIPHFDDIAEEQEQWNWETQIKDISHGKRPSEGGSSTQSFSVAQKIQQRKPRSMDPIDLYFMKDADEVVKQRKNIDGGKLFDENRKKMGEYAVQKFCRWMYDTGIPFNTVRADSFGPAIEALGQFGPGMKPSSYHEAKYSCTLMANGWTDTRQMRLINFLVNSPKGSKFIESVDGSSYAHTGEKMFELLDKYVQLVGEKNVIQVVIDNASANVLAAHYIDLMFEDIFKLPNLKKTYERGVMINAYIYNRPPLLDIMRDFTKSREMVRPAKTRFATAFLTLKRFHIQKGNLRKMFTSEQWTKSRYAREAQGKLVASVILMPSFWNHVLYIIKIAGPLVKVLQLVDGERKPPMGYIYEAMDRAKEAIAASFSNNEEKYKDVFALIDARWNVQLHRPLHAAGYYLNLEFFYAHPNIEQDTELHSKKRNKFEQKRLNDLVFIKYNRTLKRRYDARDAIDPIILDEIDESNEWLLWRLTLDSDEENATVFEDNDLTWGDVARAAGVDEDAYSLRSQSTIEPRGKLKASSSKASKKASASK